MRKIPSLMALLVVLFLSLAAWADGAASPPSDKGPPPPVPKDTEGYEPVDGNMLSAGESIPASRLVAGAYGFILASLVVYVGSVVGRMRRVEDEIAGLRKRLDDAQGK